MKILFIGDIFGKKGREAVKKELPKLNKTEKIDFVIANAENTTHGKSLSAKHYKELLEYGVDFFTFGNHTWQLSEIKQVLSNKNTIRPLNIKDSSNEYKYGGEGTRVCVIKDKKIRITNLLGMSVSANEIQTNPFVTLNELCKSDDSDIHFVDFHCESTSEKNALALEFSSKVSAIVGTHTHIQTSDERIFKNTAIISDVGMTGGSEGIIGAEPETILKVFNGEASRFKLSPSLSPYQFNGVVIEFSDKNNKPINIKRIFIREND